MPSAIGWVKVTVDVGEPGGGKPVEVLARATARRPCSRPSHRVRPARTGVRRSSATTSETPDPAAGAQHPEHLGEHGRLVGGQVDHAVGDHHVHAAVRQRDLLDVPLQELHVGRARLRRRCAGPAPASRRSCPARRPCRSGRPGGRRATRRCRRRSRGRARSRPARRSATSSGLPQPRLARRAAAGSSASSARRSSSPCSVRRRAPPARSRTPGSSAVQPADGRPVPQSRTPRRTGPWTFVARCHGGLLV